MLRMKYKDKESTEFSQLLRALRLKTHQTQKEVYQKTSIPETKISKYENGKQIPSFKNLDKLIAYYIYCQVLSVPEANTLRYKHKEIIYARGYDTQPLLREAII